MSTPATDCATPPLAGAIVGQSMTQTMGLSPVLRARRKSRGFALTPLADIMFQLLLFFMLTSALAPYALLPLGAPAGTSTQPEAQAAQPLPDASGTLAESQAVWHLGRNEIRSGQVRIALDLLPQALDGLQADGIRDLVVLVTGSAQAADLARLLEAIRQADITRLQLVGG